jgi:hypothetical protein
MIVYADGTEVQVGDRVDYDGDPSIVEAVIDSVDACEEWGLTQRGLMFKNATFGLVFEPVSSLTWHAIRFIGRGA